MINSVDGVIAVIALLCEWMIPSLSINFVLRLLTSVHISPRLISFTFVKWINLRRKKGRREERKYPQNHMKICTVHNTNKFSRFLWVHLKNYQGSTFWLLVSAPLSTLSRGTTQANFCNLLFISGVGKKTTISTSCWEIFILFFSTFCSSRFSCELENPLEL